MPQRSKVQALPEPVRQELDKRLIANGFGSYVELAEWLTSEGFEISHAAVHRYGTSLETRIEKIRLASQHAKALVDAAGDTGALAEASIQLIQERMWDVLMSAEEGDIKELSAAARALADAARASVSVQQERRKVRAEIAAQAETEAVKLGLSRDNGALLRDALKRAG